MFEKSDKTLFLTRLTLILLLVIISILSAIGSIIFFTIGDTIAGVKYIIVAVLYPSVGWIILNFLLAYATDIKLIRNKLYNENNEFLAEFFSDNNITEKYNQNYSSSVDKKALEENLENLKKLKDLYDNDIISQEEFEVIKKKHIKNLM